MRARKTGRKDIAAIKRGPMTSLSAKPVGIIVLAWVHFLAGAAMIASPFLGGHSVSMGAIIIGVIYFGFGFVLRTFQPWALYLAIALYVISALGAVVEGEWFWALSLTLLVAYLSRRSMREAYLSANPNVETFTISGHTEVPPTHAEPRKGSPTFGLVVIISFVITLAMHSYGLLRGWPVGKFQDYQVRLAAPGLKIPEEFCGPEHSHRVHGIVAEVDAQRGYYELADEDDASKSVMIFYSDKTSQQPQPVMGSRLTTTLYLGCGIGGAIAATESARER